MTYNYFTVIYNITNIYIYIYIYIYITMYNDIEQIEILKTKLIKMTKVQNQIPKINLDKCYNSI